MCHLTVKEINSQWFQFCFIFLTTFFRWRFDSSLFLFAWRSFWPILVNEIPQIEQTSRTNFNTNSPVFILLTKIRAMDFWRTWFFSSSSCTYYDQSNHSIHTRIKSNNFRSFLCSLHSWTSCVMRGLIDTSLSVSEVNDGFITLTHNNGIIWNLHFITVRTPSFDRIADLINNHQNTSLCQ